MASRRHRAEEGNRRRLAIIVEPTLRFIGTGIKFRGFVQRLLPSGMIQIDQVDRRVFVIEPLLFGIVGRTLCDLTVIA